MIIANRGSSMLFFFSNIHASSTLIESQFLLVMGPVVKNLTLAQLMQAILFRQQLLLLNFKKYANPTPAVLCIRDMRGRKFY